MHLLIFYYFRYGDKAPKSLQGRVFGIFWITMGIAISGIFTASLTSALTSSLIEEEINLSGKMVLTFCLSDLYVIYQQQVEIFDHNIKT